MNVIVDIDNTIADYTGALRDTARRLGFPGPCPDPADYDFGLTRGWPWGGCGFPAFHAHAVEGGLYLTERPYAGAADALDTLRDLGHRVLIATARTDDPSDHTRRWLDLHGFGHDGLYFGDKLDLRADALIDDRPDTIRRAHAAGLTVLHPAHAYCLNEPGITFERWADVPALLKEAFR